MNPRYEVITTLSGNTVINAWYENGIMLSIPTDPANADYQAYLNKDNPDWGKPGIPVVEETAPEEEAPPVEEETI
jgi:hypothetical protein